ncbi:uncharacterized protein BJ212DRAFT_170015 [Suillus subaureus]|uniref:Uncharacterized protein n=1 Tax=Suillus subaureus TaxID=48587 RepID=A0A9P7JDF9_9AGAM|nr:uncharacterized protein BJ212DRAFT_170015 [Suillus subaureus]KAG1816721.1 hypothetical protein BJ212DRAFT_170015 [Suillus subaureus]
MKSVCTISQTFGSSVSITMSRQYKFHNDSHCRYWNTTPTDLQWATMGFISSTYGAIGSRSYQYPTTTGNIETIEGTVINLNVIRKHIVQPFIADPNATFASYNYQVMDTGLWYNGTVCLLIIPNLGNAQVHMPWNKTGLPITTNATMQLQHI